MGQIVSKHSIRFSTLIGRIIAILVLLGVGIAGFFSIKYLFPEGLETSPYFQYIPLIVFLFGMVQVMQTWSLLNSSVTVYEHGLQKGRRQWTWADITAYSAKQINYRYMGFIPTGSSLHYTIVMADGAIMMDSTTYNNVAEFGDYVMNKISTLPKQPTRY